MSADNWAHRTKGMRCRTCMWFVEKESTTLLNAGADRIGRCRKHAPTMQGFPVIYESDWCGDHKLDEEKVAVQHRRDAAQQEVGPPKTDFRYEPYDGPFKKGI